MLRSAALGALCAATLLSAFAAGQEPARPRRPNFVFLFADDHAQRAHSAYRNALCATPQIDRLAREGVRFASSFVTNSICGPSRAVVLTGLHSHRNGFLQNG